MEKYTKNLFPKNIYQLVSITIGKLSMKWRIKLNLVYLATGTTSPCENSGLSSISFNKYWSRYWSQFKEIKMWTMSLDNELLRKFWLLIMIIIWRPQNHHSTITKMQIKITTTNTNKSHITINETRTEHIQISYLYRSGKQSLQLIKLDLRNTH